MLESSAGANRGTPQRWRRAAALGLLATLALLVAGCGGGGGSDGESEAAARKKLEAAATKVSGAEALHLSLAFESEEDGVTEPLGCLNLAVETTKPERVDLLFFDQTCEGGIEAHELIAIGHRAWGSSGEGSWRQAKITPALLREISDEQTDFSQLMAAAEDIESTPGGGAVDEGDSDFVDATTYSFEAPASAFPGTDEDLGDLKVEFEATIDHHGYLRELIVHGDEDGAGATVTAKYEDIDKPQHIEPPSPSEVQGPVSPIETRDELDALFGVGTP